MGEGILAALITGGLSLVGVIISGVLTTKKTETAMKVAQAVTDTKLEELTREVRSHNNFAQRIGQNDNAVTVVNLRMVSDDLFADSGKTLHRRATTLGTKGGECLSIFTLIDRSGVTEQLGSSKCAVAAATMPSYFLHAVTPVILFRKMFAYKLCMAAAFQQPCNNLSKDWIISSSLPSEEPRR